MGYFSTLTIRGSGLRKFKESLQEQIPNSELNKFLENLGKNAKMPRTQGFQVVGAGNAKNCEVKTVWKTKTVLDWGLLMGCLLWAQ